jgi:hypothetical protein
MRAALLAGCAVAVGILQALAADAVAKPKTQVVTYEAFGAAGDGVTDDLPAICKAHAYANQHGLRVQSNPKATYHLGRRALTAIIATDTDWSTSRFIIDDSQGVKNSQKPLFEVRSQLKPVTLKIDRLTRGQTRLNLRPASDCLVLVENKHHNSFIRRGLNQNNGTGQKEVFTLRRDGSIEGVIDWDYDVVTRVEAQPIDPERLVLRGGIFTNIANRLHPKVNNKYWDRNIRISRSNTEVDGVALHVIGETESGHPYGGFLSVQQCANVTLRNCQIDGRKTYETIGSAGKPVSKGTYGYTANLVVNFRMIRCRMKDIHDRTRWGVIGCNFMKNILLEDCVLSRMDVHQGVSGSYIIRRTTLGHAGLNAIGRGRRIIEDSTLYGRNLVSFRPDYGSTWEREVLIRNSRWIPPAGRAGGPVMFGMQNDGMHDFGYPCSMPRVIRIEGLFVDDSKQQREDQGVTFFSDPLGSSRDKRPFPYRLTERLELRGLQIASGRTPRVCSNPEVARASTVVLASGSPSGESRSAGWNEQVSDQFTIHKRNGRHLSEAGSSCELWSIFAVTGDGPGGFEKMKASFNVCIALVPEGSLTGSATAAARIRRI